ncbi:MAG: hypothetical protein AB8H80_05355 [Planctomycetota bacterium]
MIRLILTGALALFLVACQGEPAGDTGGTNPTANAVATDASCKLELGQPI